MYVLRIISTHEADEPDYGFYKRNIHLYEHGLRQVEKNARLSAKIPGFKQKKMTLAERVFITRVSLGELEYWTWDKVP